MTTEAIRPEVGSAHRVVVKVGSSSLTSRGRLDDERLRLLVAAIADRRAAGSEVVLVSSGAIAAGIAPLSLRRRPRDLATQQAAASVGQGLLLARYTEAFAAYGLTVGQVLLTVDDVTRRSHYRNAYRTFARLLELGVLPIVNENDTVATSEIRFGDNDRLAALTSHLVHADLLVLLSDVDGLYTGDPSQPASRLVAEVNGHDDLAGVDAESSGPAGVGSGGMGSKIEAARIAAAAGVPVVVAGADHAAAILRGEPGGTLFRPTGRRRKTRLLWLEHATGGLGRIGLDDGAVRALTQRGASLLPAGITDVDGTFTAGDPVDLVDATGVVVARGISNYDATELPALIGRHTDELPPEQQRVVMHRDDLVVLRRGSS